MRGIHRSLVDSLHKGPWRRALMFSLICAWTNGWANNREAGDLRRHSAHYDVTVMYFLRILFFHWTHYLSICKAKTYYCHDTKFASIIPKSTEIQLTWDILVDLFSPQRKHQSSASLTFAWNSPMTGEFPAQMASDAENVFIWWRQHVKSARL